MAISGTSMATPHVGGMAGVILDIAPSLGVADYHREDHDEGNSLVGGDGTAAYGQFEDWDTAAYSRVHELELILELTARYEGMANSCEDGNSEDSCNDIPEECYRSATGECHDWRIGHGLTDVDAAVALARTLELMRDQDGDGFVDHPEYTVWDAWEIYESMMVEQSIPVNTDRVSHSWKGDWNHFNNGATGAVYYTEDSHYVWIPNGTKQMEVRFALLNLISIQPKVVHCRLKLILEKMVTMMLKVLAPVYRIPGYVNSMSNPLIGTNGRILMWLAKPLHCLE